MKPKLWQLIGVQTNQTKQMNKLDSAAFTCDFDVNVIKQSMLNMKLSNLSQRQKNMGISMVDQPKGIQPQHVGIDIQNCLSEVNDNVEKTSQSQISCESVVNRDEQIQQSLCMVKILSQKQQGFCNKLNGVLNVVRAFNLQKKQLKTYIMLQMKRVYQANKRLEKELTDIIVAVRNQFANQMTLRSRKHNEEILQLQKNKQKQCAKCIQYENIIDELRQRIQGYEELLKQKQQSKESSKEYIVSQKASGSLENNIVVSDIELSMLQQRGDLIKDLRNQKERLELQLQISIQANAEKQIEMSQKELSYRNSLLQIKQQLNSINQKYNQRIKIIERQKDQLISQLVFVKEQFEEERLKTKNQELQYEKLQLKYRKLLELRRNYADPTQLTNLHYSFQKNQRENPTNNNQYEYNYQRNMVERPVKLKTQATKQNIHDHFDSIPSLQFANDYMNPSNIMNTSQRRRQMHRDKESQRKKSNLEYAYSSNTLQPQARRSGGSYMKIQPSEINNTAYHTANSSKLAFSQLERLKQQVRKQIRRKIITK